MQPDWGDYTSIQNWFWKVTGEFKQKYGVMPSTAHIPRNRWEKVRMNHFISIGGLLFFGLAVEVLDNDVDAYVSNKSITLDE